MRATRGQGRSYNWDEQTGAMTWPVIHIRLAAGSHSASVGVSFTANATGLSRTLVLDLSSFTTAEFIAVDMATKAIVHDGTIDPITHIITGGAHRADLRASAVDTYWGIPAGGGTFQMTNTTHISEAACVYNQARAG